jgi:creatinine amidohydrolase
MQLEEYLTRDDRVVLPVGSTEQHAYLSVGTDSILAERVSVEAAEPLGVPVLPVLAYGLAPYFAAFPGSPTLRVETFLAVLRDLLDSLHGQGFRRILLVNGHGGNVAGAALTAEWMAANPGAQAIFHNWWNGPRTWAAVQEIDSESSHASWLESFPWTRVEGVEPPRERKPLVDRARLAVEDPAGVRRLLGDGSYGGVYSRSDEDWRQVWQTGVEEVREVLEYGWR